MRLGAKAYQIGTEQLRLNHTELAVYAHRCGTELSDEQVQTLLYSSEGWFSAVSVKSHRSKFCCIRSLWTDFGITTTPLCMRKRSAVCAAVLPHFAPIREETRLSAKI